MKNINPCALFDKYFLLERLTKLKNPLVKLKVHIDRLSIKQLRGLKSSDKVLDSKTTSKLRGALIQEKLVEALFFRFNQALDDQCFLAKNGQLGDVAIVATAALQGLGIQPFGPRDGRNCQKLCFEES